MAERFLKYDTKNRPNNVDKNGCLTGANDAYFLHLTEDDIVDGACPSIVCKTDDMVKALEKGRNVWLVLPDGHRSQIIQWDYHGAIGSFEHYLNAVGYWKGMITEFMLTVFDYKPSV